MTNKTGTISKAVNEAPKSFLNFINDTKDGKYTEQKPEVIQITYQRIETQENKGNNPLDENISGIALFGLTF